MNDKIISSTENTYFKNLKKIYRSKIHRKKLNKTLLDGPHLIRTFLDSGRDCINFIVDESSHSNEIELLIRGNPNVDLVKLNHELFCKISDLNSSTGLMALIEIPLENSTLQTKGFHLILNDIQDPGNVGSILRSHAALGNDFVFLSKGCCDLWSPKTIRGSQGVQFFLRCFEDQDIRKLIENFNFPTYCLSMKGKSLFSHKFQQDIAMILGNEGHGIDVGLSQKAHETLAIPMVSDIESLNVSAAASIVMYEYARQLKLT